MLPSFSVIKAIVKNHSHQRVNLSPVENKSIQCLLVNFIRQKKIHELKDTNTLTQKLTQEKYSSLGYTWLTAFESF